MKENTVEEYTGSVTRSRWEKNRERRTCVFVSLIVLGKKPEAAGALILWPTSPLWSGSLRLTVVQELDVSGKSPLNLSTWGLTRRFVHHLY